MGCRALFNELPVPCRESRGSMFNQQPSFLPPKAALNFHGSFLFTGFLTQNAIALDFSMRRLHSWRPPEQVPLDLMGEIIYPECDQYRDGADFLGDVIVTIPQPSVWDHHARGKDDKSRIYRKRQQKNKTHESPNRQDSRHHIGRNSNGVENGGFHILQGFRHLHGNQAEGPAGPPSPHGSGPQYRSFEIAALPAWKTVQGCSEVGMGCRPWRRLGAASLPPKCPGGFPCW